MDGSVETSRPTLGPKPLLAPKPFSLQKSSTIRSIHAPRATSKTTNVPPGKAETTSVPKAALPTAAQPPPQHTTAADPKPKATSENQQRVDPVPQTTGVPKASSPTTPQAPPQQTPTPDCKPSPGSERIKDEPKTDNVTEERQNREGSSVSAVAPAKSDPVPQTTGAPKGTAQKAHQSSGTDEPSPVREPIADGPKPTDPRPHKEDTPTAAPAKLAPAPQTAPSKEAAESKAVQKEAVGQAHHQAPAAAEIQNNEEHKSSVIQKPEESGSVSPTAANPAYQWGGTRRRLSSKLTSKFESSGPPVSPQPTAVTASAGSTASSKDSVKKAAASSPEQSQTAAGPPKRPGNEGELIDYSGGDSIKRRISQLFDSSLRPEAATRKEEPDIKTGSGGVKARIKNWVVDPSSEEPKPRVVPRTRSNSAEPPASPVGDETPQRADVQLPAAGAPTTPAAAPTTEDSTGKPPAEIPVEASGEEEAAQEPLDTGTDVPGERAQSKPAEPEATLRSSAIKRNNGKRRSVRFGIVETDDGEPPLILGSPSDSSSEEDDAPKDKGDKGEEDTSASFPVYRRVGAFGNKDGETQRKEAEREKQVELEKRLKAEENKQEGLKSEGEREQVDDEREKENARQREELRRRDEEKQREEEREAQRLKEVQRQKEEEQERQRLKEEERKRLQERQVEEERERLKQKEQEERLRLEEMERERLKEEERKKQVESLQQRQVEEERERLKQKEQEEREKEKLREDKEKELELKRQKEEERRRLEEMERERVRKEAEERERENKRRLEEEERMKARQRQEEEEERRRRMELETRIQQEKEKERMRQLEIQREEERKKQLEKERVKELERQMQEDLERQRLNELEDELGMEEAKKAEKEDLIRFDSEDVPQKSEALLSSVPKPREPPENEVEIIYDDFSVKKPQIDVDFEDFSVKPRRWGSQAKVETPPVRSWRSEPVDESAEALVRVHPQENRAPEKAVKPDNPEPPPALGGPEEEEQEEEEQRSDEEQLVSEDPEEDAEEEEESEHTEEADTTDNESEDEQEAQVNSYYVNPEDKDTDVLIDTSPDQQNGFCEQTAQTDSPKSVPEDGLEVSPEDVEPADSPTQPDVVPFPESSTPLLDTRMQRSKADLSRRRSRSRPSRSLRLAQTESHIWRVSTDEKNGSIQQDDSEPEEKQPKLHKAGSPSPRLNPAAQLIAQLKRRTSGGDAAKGEAKEEGKQRDENRSQPEEAAPPPSAPLSAPPTAPPRSPRHAAQLAGAALVLPPLGSSDGGAVSSPAWLKELKSKKRLSQHDSET